MRGLERKQWMEAGNCDQEHEGTYLSQCHMCHAKDMKSQTQVLLIIIMILLLLCTLHIFSLISNGIDPFILNLQLKKQRLRERLDDLFNRAQIRNQVLLTPEYAFFSLQHALLLCKTDPNTNTHTDTQVKSTLVPNLQSAVAWSNHACVIFV